MAEWMTIGEAAAMSGVSPKAVRLYEQRGLLPEVRRSSSGYRLFSENHVETLRFITRARTAGLSLGDIGTVLSLQREGHAPCAHVRSALDRRLGELDGIIAELTLLRDRIRRLQDQAPDGQEPEAGFCSIIQSQLS
ncbi:heavy metal-responsive transcriptional regulator [Nocardiopsis gilva YIM 90087]|uniref:Heavy metal-responsive transcriptional regulator n=1 Tax=Nocardiopsis gilva YIM 90087 TaxID=1235441 RepID=A0A223S004_9ACTN|nr:heavy metal-responsive transcriptional regulator [Nocardiopsis gilva]ASU81444.1 heavy metal-responsive transcriptional regulator [Nocardiopsis gilva YIM 90087]